MLFNSYEFIFLFLPVVFFGFFRIARSSHRLAALWLAAASLFFYGWWNPKFVLLLLASICFNYAFGYAIGHARNTPRAKLLLAVAVVANLALLVLFKYTNFFIATVNSVTGNTLPVLDIVLPLGISFYTFIQIAFLVDNYRGIAREYNFIHYMLFVSYFPHLIAGPVLHHKQMMPQFGDPATYSKNLENIAAGLTIFTIGLAKKVLLADSFAEYATPVFNVAGSGAHPQVFAAWTGALAYTLQLYFDFSGYSDMAIGLSRLFGVHLPINFDSPYKARNIIDFWRRWHMTLSQFLRDYLYVPLGGNRHGRFRRYINLLVTMLLGGLWHGANWTFVVWGGMHGIYLVINHAWQRLMQKLGFAGAPTWWGALLGTGLTFLAVVVAWVVFRANSLHAATIMLNNMFPVFDQAGAFGHEVSFSAGMVREALETYKQFFASYGLGIRRFALLLAAGLAIVWFAPNTQSYMERKVGEGKVGAAGFFWRPTALNAVVWGAVLAVCLTKMVSVSEFLYFQF
jgi:alginate O-acetyltransferase complex protein AlgI